MTHFTPIVPKKRSISNAYQNTSSRNSIGAVRIKNNYFENNNNDNSIENNNVKGNTVLKISRNWILPPRPRPGRKSIDQMDSNIFQKSQNGSSSPTTNEIDNNGSNNTVLAFLNLDDNLSQTSTIPNDVKQLFNKDNNTDMIKDGSDDINLNSNIFTKKIKSSKNHKSNNKTTGRNIKNENCENINIINTTSSENIGLKKNKSRKIKRKDNSNKITKDNIKTEEDSDSKDIAIDLFNFKLKIKKELLNNQDEFILDSLNKKYDESLLTKENQNGLTTPNLLSQQSSEKSILMTKDLKKLRNNYHDDMKKKDSFILNTLSPSTTLVPTPINNGYDIDSIMIPNIHSNYNSTKNFDSMNDNKCKEFELNKPNDRKFNINYNYDISNNTEFIESSTNESMENNIYDNIWTFIPRYTNNNNSIYYNTNNNQDSITTSKSGTIDDDYVYIAPSLEELIDEQDCML